MSFEEALATQPAWVQIWVTIMGLVIAVSVVAMLIHAPTRRDAVIVAVAMAATVAAMQWLYAKVGYVRLLGIVHVVIWTPLVIYLWRRLSDPRIASPFRQLICLFLATLIVSLAFDYADVARYLLGERGSMIPSARG